MPQFPHVYNRVIKTAPTSQHCWEDFIKIFKQGLVPQTVAAVPVAVPSTADAKWSQALGTVTRLTGERAGQPHATPRLPRLRNAGH